MLEHDDVGSACTFPPPPLLLLLLLLPLPPPPPQPAAVTASTANSPITPTALKLYFTLPPPSPVCANGVRSGAVSGLGRSDASGSECRDACGERKRRVHDARTMGAQPQWRNWQTRRTQNPVPFGECGFKSHLRHCRTISLSGIRRATRRADP